MFAFGLVGDGLFQLQLLGVGHGDGGGVALLRCLRLIGLAFGGGGVGERLFGIDVVLGDGDRSFAGYGITLGDLVCTFGALEGDVVTVHVIGDFHVGQVGRAVVGDLNGEGCLLASLVRAGVCDCLVDRQAGLAGVDGYVVFVLNRVIVVNLVVRL